MPETLISTDIASATRELVVKSVEEEVFTKTPLLAKLRSMKQITFRGGKSIKWPRQVYDMEDLAQDYGTEDGLDGGNKDILDWAELKWRNTQLPIWTTLEDELINDGGDPEQILDIAALKAEKCNTGLLQHLQTSLYRTAATVTTKNWSSLPLALTHDQTYAGVSRATTVTNAEFQSASLDGTYADQATETYATIDNFRQMMDKCRRHAGGGDKYVVVCGNTLYRAFLNQCEARKISIEKGDPNVVKYGHQSFMIDGVEFLKDSWLSEKSRDTELFILNMSKIEMRIHVKRSFILTPRVWQGGVVGGQDAWLQRLMVMGNFVVYAPNTCMYKTNVIA